MLYIRRRYYEKNIQMRGYRYVNALRHSLHLILRNNLGLQQPRRYGRIYDQG